MEYPSQMAVRGEISVTLDSETDFTVRDNTEEALETYSQSPMQVAEELAAEISE
ncbi:hypothetical protein [Haloarcula pellucida]|uniref:Uncharacterized protein n=1 Tax=Haloarcula pellucida TaxID=1427151 RepID=A0A830GG66_9EURY|nr:hypothetical protein [Halomicroarcula pellucida]MBX0346584.1 hypothetical protein [Halomicroarcula pellucida]GGN84408.1 hypothetical protein GCM10009030_00020 [Halomicroarcula pellucida]